MNTTREDLALIAEAHAKAMEALAADVHPYSASAVRDWEQQHAEACERVAAELERLERERAEDTERLHRLAGEWLELWEDQARLRDGLRRLLDCRGPYEGTVSERGGDPAVCPECASVARALLSASQDVDPCTNCDGLGHNTGWPHTTCPICGGSGQDREETA